MRGSLELKSVGNARQLGGIAIKDKKVKNGILLRTASLSFISDQDRQALEQEYRVAYIMDLRMGIESKAAPDPVLEGALNVPIPVLEALDFPGVDEEKAKLLVDPKADRFALIKEACDHGMLDDTLYVDFLFSDRGKKAYRELFRCLLKLPEGRAFLWHCTDGKDRTGVASMLILSALGADRETIMEEYLLTNEYNAKKLEAAAGYFDQMGLSDELREMALFGAGAVSEKFMANGFKAIDERCGSTEAYLEKELGVSAADCEMLRGRMLK